MSDFLVIAGLSGGGRSTAGDALEDLGWFVIDNLPPALIPKVGELASGPGGGIERIALVVGSGAYQDDVHAALQALSVSIDRVRILFLDASTEVLVRRYESTRRRHPLADGDSLAGAIERERAVLDAVKAEADLVIDTTELNVHELTARIVDLFGADSPDTGMRTSLVSFGFKHGAPRDADMVVDCRFLPNPYWVEDLRDRTGLDEDVRGYVLRQEVTGDFLGRLDHLLDLLLPAYVAEGKSYFRLAFGCTGGHHRSVVIAEEVAGVLRRRGADPTVDHRDIEK